MAEYLDIVDQDGVPTGETVLREKAHREGIPHRTAHVWVVRRPAPDGAAVQKPAAGPEGRALTGTEDWQVLLQKRSPEKDSYPGEWDISSAGHIPAGQEWRASAVRELAEEIGVAAGEDDLTEVQLFRIQADDEFHGIPYHDRQISKIFLLYLDRAAEEFSLQREELTEVRWFALDAVVRDVSAGRMGEALMAEEVRIVQEAVRAHAAELLAGNDAVLVGEEQAR
jgi:isopentenyldiphosphate isomerase